MDAITTPPAPVNEPNLMYAPGSPERTALETELAKLERKQHDFKAHIGGRRRSGGGREITVVQPHDHQHVLGVLKNSTTTDAEAAVKAAAKAAPDWRRLPFDERAAIILKAADLLSGPWRQRLNAATMLGQSKTAFQAEIDAACELIDFWRFNVHYARQILAEQAALCEVRLRWILFKQREDLVARFRLAIGQQLKLAEIAAIGIDRGTQHIGFHHRARALRKSGLGRCGGRGVQPLAWDGWGACADTRRVRRRDGRRRRRMLVLPGLPQQKQGEGKDNKKNQPLVIHGTGRYELGWGSGVAIRGSPDAMAGHFAMARWPARANVRNKSRASSPGTGLAMRRTTKSHAGSSGKACRKLSRTHRLTRLRSTARASSRLATTMPNRGYPTWLGRAITIR